MKLLWAKTDFLHPTTRGGQIRTLEMLRQIHRRHEVHYVAFDNPALPEGVARAKEYSSFRYPLKHETRDKASAVFALDLAAGVFDKLPLAVGRYRSRAMRDTIEELSRRHKFDSIVCDFLAPAPNMPDLSNTVLFQHNVEYVIWKRQAADAQSLAKKLYFKHQAGKMFRYERDVCRAVKHVVAVSETDCDTMSALYGVDRISWVPTGVDTEYFSPPASRPLQADLVFVGSMDWMPNIDGVNWFMSAVLPLIRAKRPDCTVAIVGRSPGGAIKQLAEHDPHITVTGTVPDVRPWLWGSKVSIVPLRVGGGTRLKIYEAMAAKTPVVSTAIGAEGLEVHDGQNIAIADEPADFADRTLALLDSEPERGRLAAAACEMVRTKYSWDAVARRFEGCLWS